MDLRNSSGLALVVAILMAAPSCANDSTLGDGRTGEEADTVEGTVLVFAAASLAGSFGEIQDAFEREYPDARVQLNLAGSSSLREQILAGAPADVFASANESNMGQVIESGEAVGESAVFARNRMQIAVPAGNPGEVAGLTDLARGDLAIGLCAEGVPCGDFARDVLANAGVQASVDTNESDVRALTTKIAADELDAGIVYVTDVVAAGQLVEGIEIPESLNVEATYPIVELAAAPNPGGAEAFVEFVLSDAGRSILADSGFGPP